ncbi:MAG TPA: exosortase/archaeosortase family protein [Candidatus Avibacteroides excrementipullorum]|nr:exosortase/archaeosortase family protein [Candidatus Avibacteroides excrementipullorum]
MGRMGDEICRMVHRFRVVMIFVLTVVCFNRLFDIISISGLDNRKTAECGVGVLENVGESLWTSLGVEYDNSTTDLQYLSILGKDVTHVVAPVNEFLASACVGFLGLFCDKAPVLEYSLHNGAKYRTVISADDGSGRRLEIMHECTGLKQVVVLFIVSLFVGGGIRRKTSFFVILSGLFLLFNFVRIVMLAVIFMTGSDWFGFMHDYVFSYGLYAFLLLCVFVWNVKMEKR